MLLSGKRALVYGASGAVGAAVAEAFVREGATVILSARTANPLETVRQRIIETGGQASVLTVDALSPQSVRSHLDEITRRFGTIDIMFNAISWADIQGSPLVDMPITDYLKPIEIGLATWFHTGTLVANHMAAHGGGVILGITANAGRQAFSGVGGFGVACAAVEHFLRQLAVENGPKKVRVCWVRSPGSPDSPGVREAWEIYGRQNNLTFDEVHALFSKDTPLRRVASLAEVANAATLLASDLALSLTATMANATGGAQVD